MKVSKNFNLSLYTCSIKFIICPSIQEEFDKISKKEKEAGKFNITFKGDAGGLAFSSNVNQYYLLLRDDSIAHSYLSHEIYHTVERIAKDRGIKDEEARAYLQGHITRWIYGFLIEKKIKIGNI